MNDVEKSIGKEEGKTEKKLLWNFKLAVLLRILNCRVFIAKNLYDTLNQ